jgi:hypothetical protein
MTVRPSLASLSALLVGVVSLLLLGCGSSENEAGAESRTDDGASPTVQTAYRIRADLSAGLNADDGWAAGLNEPASFPVERPFRIRFEVETPADAPFVERFQLQYQRNGGDWYPVLVGDFPYPAGATPRVSIVSVSSYEDRDDTRNVLAASTAPFAGGSGVSLSGRTIALAEPGVQSEWEWPVVIRRFADGAVTNEDGDRFAFRMVDVNGQPVAAESAPEVTVTVPPRLLAGTYPETPGQIGPWQTSDGSLYFLMEPAETYNVLMTVKSEDGGKTWREVDGANRPLTGDLEGFASAFHDGTIHMLHQIDEGVLHHAFETTDAGADTADGSSTGPDAWTVRDDTIATPGEPLVQVTSIASRPDGSLVAVYGGPADLRYKIRSAEGLWGEEVRVATETSDTLSGPQTVTGQDGVVHLSYTRSDGTAWYRRIRPDGSATSPQQVAAGLGTAETDIGSVLPLVYLPNTNTTVILYRTADGILRERRIQDGTLREPVQVTERAVVQSAVDSDQTGADAIGIDSSVHVLFIEEGTGRLFHTSADDDRVWSPASVQVDSVYGQPVNTQWVRGQPVTPQGASAPVYGFVYDGGSNGGSGLNIYDEVPLP